VETCFLQNTTAEFLVDFIISTIAHLSDQKESMSSKIEDVVKKLDVYLVERQHQMKVSDILKQRMELRNVLPKDPRDRLIEFGEEKQKKNVEKKQQQNVKKDILNNLENIRGAAMRAKEIDILLVTDIFSLEDFLESNESADSAMKSVLEKLLPKYEENKYWLKPLQSAIEIVGWMQLKEGGTVEFLKAIITEVKRPLFIQVCAAETLFKLHTGNKDGNISCSYHVLILLGTSLLSEDERDIALEVVTHALNCEGETKEIAVRALSIPGVV
jgi:hypothetical protein